MHVFRDGFDKGDRCSCGEAAGNCPVWGSVWKRGNHTRHSLTELSNLQQSFSWHTSFWRVLFGWFRAEEKSRFSEINRNIFETAADQAGVDYVIDSSKYAARAIAIKKHLSLPLSVIFISRSPAGLMHAFSRPAPEGEQLPKPPLQVLAYYVYTTLCARIATLVLGDRCMRISYEDLRSDPVEVLARVSRHTGLDVSAAARKLDTNSRLAPGHIVTGNRLRLSADIRFKAAAGKEVDLRGLKRVCFRIMEFWRWLIKI